MSWYPKSNHSKTMSEKKQKPIRVIFTEGGKGGVGKTEIAINLTTWLRSHGIEPQIIDFDAENTEKSGLQCFFPEATKLDVHQPGALDHVFEACETKDPRRPRRYGSRSWRSHLRLV